MAALLAIISFVSSGNAAASACTGPHPALLAVDKIKGIRTKWLSYARDRRNSVQPDLAHLPLAEWMRNLEAIGVNLAEINLEPQRKLARRPRLSSQALTRTLDAIYTPRQQRSPAQSEAVSAFENEIVPHWQYDREQRDDILLDFLRRLEALRRKGRIAGTVRFVIHQRLWFRAGARPNLVYQRARRVGEFAQDMATFIRRADAACLGHWIAGIRLGEHSNDDMNELLPLIVNIARAINRQTRGWLKNHLFVVNGGGWGANYRGIAHVVGPDGRPFPFFPDIAAEAGAFTFGYKFMQFRGIERYMATTACAPYRMCSPGSVADWKEYLGPILGFDELVAYLKANQRQFPADANVVFTGDSSDAATSMVSVGPNGGLVDRPPLVALRQLFMQAGPVATRGKIFMNGYSHAKTIFTYRPGGPVDIGRALYFVSDKGQVQRLPQSDRIWADWPRE